MARGNSPTIDLKPEDAAAQERRMAGQVERQQNKRFSDGDINPATGRPVGDVARERYAMASGKPFTPSDAKVTAPQNRQLTAYGFGGYSADEMTRYLDDFMSANQDGQTWTNGFSAAGNQQSMSNLIRQQMKSNSDAWEGADDAWKGRLHEQNVQLAALLPKYLSGGGKSEYNEDTGRWETDDGQYGYGYNRGAVFDPAWKQQMYGQTPEQMEAYANDTDRYYNWVSQGGKRNWVDESGGFTGKYSQFEGGRPYGALLMEAATGYVNPAVYTDLVGDGFNDEAYWTPVVDAEGNIVPQKPALKGNNSLTDYTASKAAYVDEYGIIQPGILNGTKSPDAWRNMWLNGGNYVEGDNGIRRLPVTAHTRTGMGRAVEAEKALGMGQFAPDGAESYEEYINNVYDSSLAAQLAALEQQYAQGQANLDAQSEATEAQYLAALRTAAGNADRAAAANREAANAGGVGSGTLGQSMIADANQTAAQIGNMNAAQAQALADLEMQRATLAKSYQQQIAQAEAANDYERAQALLAEAQRVDQTLMQQAQQVSKNNFNYMQMMGG